MASRVQEKSLHAGLGTVFVHDRRTDVVRVIAGDGSEVDVPGPDLREFLETLSPTAGDSHGSSYEAALTRARAGVAEVEERVLSEKKRAPALLEELVSAPPAERRRIACRDSRFQTPALVYLIVERAIAAVHEDLGEAGELAGLACELSAQLNPQDHGGARLRGLQALAEAVRGNAYRVAGDLRAARAAFYTAREYLSLGDSLSDDALEVEGLEIALLRDIRDFSGALSLSERVVSALLERGQDEEAAIVLMRKASVFEQMGDADGAIASLQNAVSLTQAPEDGGAGLWVRHNLAVFLARQGRVGEAKKCFEEAQPLYGDSPPPLIEAKRLWVEGILHLEDQDLDDALPVLQRARDLFEKHGYAFDLALVSLDLCAVLAGLARVTEARELAEATYCFMEVQEVHPDALAALAILRQAAAQESLTRELLSSVARRLQRAPSKPPAAS